MPSLPKLSRAAAFGAAFRGAVLLAAVWGAAVVALLILLNPAAARDARACYVAAALVNGFYLAAGAGVGVVVGLAAALAPAWAAALRRRGLGLAAAGGLVAVALAAVFRYNAAAYRLSVPPEALTVTGGYAYLLAAAGAVLLFGAAAGGERFSRGFGRFLYAALFPALYFAFPLARLVPAAPPAPAAPTVARVDTGLKVYLLGVDALDADVVYPLARSGRAPAFERLLEDGAAGELATIPPGLSPAIWTTVATGRYPRDHGVTDYEYLALTGVRTPFRVFPSRTFLSVLTRVGLAELKRFAGPDRRDAALWTIASATGLKTVVVGWLASSPPEVVDGVMVGDFYGDVLARGDGVAAAELAYPPALAPEVLRYVRRPADVRAEADARLLPPGVAPFHPELFYRVYAEGKTYEDVAAALWARENPALAMAYFNPIDALQHLYWGFRPEVGLGTPAERARWGDVVNRANLWGDEVVGAALARADERTVVVVVSDHGFQTAPWDRRLYYRLWQGRDVTGVHDVTPPPAGFVALAGGPVLRSRVLYGATVADVAPNVLYLLGLPVARDMPGRLWLEVYDPAFVARYPPRRLASYRGLKVERLAAAPGPLSAEDRRKLKALGYLQ